MKPINLILADLNDGRTNVQFTSEFAELLAAVQKTGLSGSMQLTLKISPATKSTQGDIDKVTITASSKVTNPKHAAPADFFYLTEDAELSRNHPKQHSLQLTDVTGSGSVDMNNLKKAV